MNDYARKVLIVDDTPDNIDILVDILKTDYQVMAAPNGETALKVALSSTPPDLILLDVMMPGIDGFEVCRALKDNLLTSKIPIIFVTADTDKESVSKGIKLGAYYYLTRPVNSSVVLAIVESALNQFSEYRLLQQEVEKATGTMKLMTTGCFHFRTVEETRNLAVVLAKMAPEPVQLVSGLTELMMNAVEHGNLGITYEEKGQFNEQRSLNQEIERRLALPENLDKTATITIERNKNQIDFRILDQGSGFDWQPYLEIDPARADHTHGRGIAMSRLLSFNSVEFMGAGNEVLAIYSL